MIVVAVGRDTQRAPEHHGDQRQHDRRDQGHHSATVAVVTSAVMRAPQSPISQNRHSAALGTGAGSTDDAICVTVAPIAAMRAGDSSDGDTCLESTRYATSPSMR